MSRLTFSLGEKFGLPPKKLPEIIPPRPTEGDTYQSRCSCGQGNIEYVFRHGSWLSLYSVWDGGKSFGRLTFANCCQKCQQKDEEESQREMEKWR